MGADACASARSRTNRAGPPPSDRTKSWTLVPGAVASGCDDPAQLPMSDARDNTASEAATGRRLTSRLQLELVYYSMQDRDRPQPRLRAGWRHPIVLTR